MKTVISSAARTPTGKFNGKLSQIPAPELAAEAIKAAVERANIEPGDVDYVIMGNVLTAGLGQAPARQAALMAGIPPTASAMLVNQVCASGMIAVALASQMVQTGMAKVIVAGGMESMSQAPHLLKGTRNGIKLGDTPLIDSLVHDGLICATEHWHMGNAAEAIARQFGITREEQDAFALRSHQRALAAHAEGTFQGELVPIGEVTTDEGPRSDTSQEALAKLKPFFDAQGTVTAGNASQISDGAAALVIMSEQTARDHHAPVMAQITGATYVGIEPAKLFEAPAQAAEKLCALTQTRLEDYGLIEVNEAYAAQTLANGKALDWDWDRVNVKGGAIALGHPLGASGARILVTLLHSMVQQNANEALALICHGGGGAAAMALRRP